MKTLKDIEGYAQLNNIPIMQKEGMDFLCEFIKQHQCSRILEIGSAIGYSAICMAQLSQNIHVTTIERDVERYHMAKENIQDFDLTQRIDIHLGDALEFETNEMYDFIFIDAAKAQYIKFFERYEKNLIEEGYMLSDNLDFHGFVDHPEQATSRNLRQLVRKIKSYIDYLEDHPRFETTFLKLGDGIAISHKKSEK